MKLRKFFHIGVTTAVAVAASYGIFILDQDWRLRNQTLLALRWSRQIAVQAEALVLYAHEKAALKAIADASAQVTAEQNAKSTHRKKSKAADNEDDTDASDEIVSPTTNDSGDSAVDWAVQMLSQGTDSRIFVVSKLAQKAATDSSYRFDRQSGSFDYDKVFDRETGSGIQVRVLMGHDYFLGTPNLIAQDIGLGAVFFLIWFFAVVSTRGIFGLKSQVEFKKRVSLWLAGAHPVVTILGNHIRELVKNAHAMVSATKKAHPNVLTLREAIHAEIKVLREAAREREARRQALHSLEERAASDTEAATAFSQEIQAICESYFNSPAELEKKLEPWATDADLAFHAFNSAFTATQTMSGTIRKTTAGVLEQVERLSMLRAELEAVGAMKKLQEKASAPAPAEPVAGPTIKSNTAKASAITPPKRKKSA